MKAKRQLGEVVKSRREMIGFSQRELGLRVGVKGSHIAYIEAGRRRPSLALLFRLAKNLDLNRQELFMLAHPDAASFVTPPPKNGDIVWRRLVDAAPRYSVTPGELAVLHEIRMLGRISSMRSYLSILNSIRQALATE